MLNDVKPSAVLVLISTSMKFHEMASMVNAKLTNGQPTLCRDNGLSVNSSLTVASTAVSDLSAPP